MRAHLASGMKGKSPARLWITRCPAPMTPSLDLGLQRHPLHDQSTRRKRLRRTQRHRRLPATPLQMRSRFSAPRSHRPCHPVADPKRSRLLTRLDELHIAPCRGRTKRNLVLRSPQRSAPGRVEMWRGGGRSGMSVSAPFVWRCLSGSTMAPFPHPAHRTQQADFPHCALGQDVTPSPTTGRGHAGSDVRARSTRRGARVDRSRACVA